MQVEHFIPIKNKCTRYLLVVYPKILINEFLTFHVLQAKRGFAAAAVFVFVFFGGREDVRLYDFFGL
jgi:hypothetical protein